MVQALSQSTWGRISTYNKAIDGSTDTETTAYDALGCVTQVTNPLGTFHYTPYQSTGLIERHSG